MHSLTSNSLYFSFCSLSVEDDSSDNSKTVEVKTALLADLTVSGYGYILFAHVR